MLNSVPAKLQDAALLNISAQMVLARAITHFVVSVMDAMLPILTWEKMEIVTPLLSKAMESKDLPQHMSALIINLSCVQAENALETLTYVEPNYHALMAKSGASTSHAKIHYPNAQPA